jgi:hypothetical protein
MVIFNLNFFENIDPPMTSQRSQGPKIPPKGSNINNF